jgi:hypothetical protein
VLFGNPVCGLKVDKNHEAKPQHLLNATFVGMNYYWQLSESYQHVSGEPTMKKLTVAIAAVILGVGVSAFAAEVTGVLVDEACYTKDKANVTNAHKGMSETCAQDCAKKGNTVALVTEKGDVYEVMAMGDLAGENNAKLVPHMSHKVTLTGDVMEANGKKMIHATALKMISK